MEILITGGNGFLGRHLILALQQRGDRPRALVSPTGQTTWLEERGVPIFRGDLRDPDQLHAPLRGVEGVIHLAAMIGVWRSMDDYYAVNVRGTEHLCRAALAEGVRRFIHVSTFTVYNLTGRPVTEADPLAPLEEPYSRTKADGDLLVQRLIAQERLPAVIIRPGALFGPGDRLNFGRIVQRVQTGKAIIVGSGRNALPLVYVSDMVQGLLLALDREQALGQVYNIGNDQPLTQGAFLAAIAAELGVAPPRRHVPYAALYGAAAVAERLATWSGQRIPPVVTRHGVKLYGANGHLSIRKAREELGYEPQVSVREGVRLTAAWYQQEGSRQVAPVPANVS